MFPFLPSFLAEKSSSGSLTGPRESAPASTDEEPNRGLVELDVDCGTATSDDIKIYASDTKDTSVGGKAALILFPNSSTFFVSGFCHITLLRGQASIYGYALTVGQTQMNVYAPPWSPALPLEATVKKSQSSKKGVDGTKQAVSKALKRAKRSDIIGLIGIERINELEQSQGCVVLVEAIDQKDQEWLVGSESKEIFHIFHMEQAPSYESGADCQVLSGSAMVGSKRVFEGGNVKHVDTLTIPSTWRAAVSDAASLLESTPSAKLLLCGAKGVGKSTCLRYTINTLLKKCKVMCLLDCDVGQPECGVPGTVSLQLVSEPLLGPPHLLAQRPFLSYYLGEVSAKHDPTLVIEMVSRLLGSYDEARLAFSAGKGKRWMQDQERHDDISSGRPKKERKLSQSANPFEALDVDCDAFEAPLSLPLVVNTDGYIRYMGAEILGAVVDAVGPDRVFHLMTDKDKHLPALERYKEGGENPTYSSHVATLAPGRSSPSRVSAVDLRTLRLIAYFLRDNPLLRCLDKDTVQIRSAAIVDKHGAVATALCSLSSYGIPLSQVTMQYTGAGGAIHSDALPAALNGSLVGILEVEQAKSGIGVECVARRGGGLSRCLGLGIVRHVDKRTNRLLLITPIPTAELSQNLLLSMGSMQLPLSMIYSPYMPVHPYMTTESAGDGSSKMKARNNVKRR